MPKLPYFKIRHSKIQGRGAIAVRTIRKGAEITEYTGERISHEEAENRYNDGEMSRHHTFLFDVSPKYCIDGNVGGGDAKYINHSCEPNCDALGKRGGIVIVANRTIQPGEELTYDYGYRMEMSERAAKRQYPCRCGSAGCRGTIVYLPPKKKPKKVRAKQVGTKSKASAKKRSVKTSSAKKARRTSLRG